MEWEREYIRMFHDHRGTAHATCALLVLVASVAGCRAAAPGPPWGLAVGVLAVVAAAGSLVLAVLYWRGRLALTASVRDWRTAVYLALPLFSSAATVALAWHQAPTARVLLAAPMLVMGSVCGLRTALAGAAAGALLCLSGDVLAGGLSAGTAVALNAAPAALMALCGWAGAGILSLEQHQQGLLARLVDVDPLTGLASHRRFQQQLAALVESAGDQQPLSMTLIDLRKFRLFNEEHGHLQGDRLLAHLGRTLRAALPPGALAARFGGDQFAVLLPGLDAADATTITEHLRRSIEEVDLILPDPEGREPFPVSVSVSCGVASLPEHARTARELVRHADQALYKAKFLADHRVVTFSSVFDELLEMVEEDEKSLLNSVQTLILVINAKDRYTFGHSERVMRYSLLLAEHIGLPPEETKLLRYAAFLHDIGKIEVERDLLNKPERLTTQEFYDLKMHCVWGSDIVNSLPQLSRAAASVLHHHENWDGSGYPAGLKGQGIPLLARILRITDTYDAMTTDRPYRRALSAETALAEIEAGRGTYFDPELVDAFLEVMRVQLGAGEGSRVVSLDTARRRLRN